MHEAHFLLLLALLWGAAKLAAELVERLGQPPVLGELLAEVGVESELGALLKVGPEALRLAALGVGLTVLLGWGAGRGLGLAAGPAVFLGAALMSTSVGITARVFADLRMLERHEARVVLGAAVADDVLGLLLLAIASGLYGAGSMSPAVMALRGGAAVGFLVGSILLGQVA